MEETMAPADQQVASPAPAPDAEGLAQSIKQAGKQKRGPAPVHLWNPPFCGDLDMRIARDGSWWYLGTPIGRIALVKLFASVIRKDGDDYFLVTPVEKVGITVDDAPFVAVDFRVTDPRGPEQALTFVTSLDDEAEAGPEHPIRVARDPETGEPSPYVLLRTNLEALIDRKSFYRLIEVCEHREIEGTRWFGVRSRGEFFPIIPSAELPED
ncbi:MAG: proteophosphoglycan precursor [Rhodobacteraceae bacterium]|nr:proteophosphoglycan precursor [Paracoccaceae bacterium]MBR28239.1 proteophosphoglycan precursor [Paracoccaceae bacterium]